MNFDTIKIVATDIPDAWFQCLYNVLEKGFRYIIEQGSFVGQTRCELDWIEILIRHPYQVDTEGSYNPMIPFMPESMKNIPAPLTLTSLYDYIPYIMSAEREIGELYTYGERLWRTTKTGGFYGDIKFSPIDKIVELLKHTPNTNQAILQVAQPIDLLLDDPPCLRHIDMRVKDNYLIFYPYFRSWDLWSGLPANLAAIAILQKYMADEIGIEIGPMLATSKGLHLYDYAEKLAKIRAGVITRNL